MTIRPSAELRVTSREVFAYPTESFYALGADATDPEAIAKLFRLKQREPNKPIALVAASIQQVEKFFYVTDAERKLMRKYWPGALTILLRPKTMIAAGALLGWASPGPSLLKEGRKSESSRRSARIGVRVPAHAGARKLAAAAGVPLTATSANISRRPPTKSRRVVEKTFPGILVIGGRCGRARQPSTVVRLDGKNIIILRQGAAHV